MDTKIIESSVAIVGENNFTDVTTVSKLIDYWADRPPNFSQD